MIDKMIVFFIFVNYSRETEEVLTLTGVTLLAAIGTTGVEPVTI